MRVRTFAAREAMKIHHAPEIRHPFRLHGQYLPFAHGRRRVSRAGGACRLLTHRVVDSAGTHDYYSGGPPDWRAMLAARRRGYDIAPLRARQVEVEDFDASTTFTRWTRQSLDLEAMRPEDREGSSALFLDVVPELGVREVPDPYDGGPEGFEQVLDLVERASDALVSAARRQVQHLAGRAGR